MGHQARQVTFNLGIAKITTQALPVGGFAVSIVQAFTSWNSRDGMGFPSRWTAPIEVQ